MPIGVFVMSWATRPGPKWRQGGSVLCSPIRHLRTRIRKEGGEMGQAEFGPGLLMVEVRASEAILDEIERTPGVERLPTTTRTAFTSLNLLQQQQLDRLLERAGWTSGEIQLQKAIRPNRTVGDVMEMCLHRRRCRRYDPATGQHFFDGPWRDCQKTLAELERGVRI